MAVEASFMTLKAIGFVRSEIKQPAQREWGEVVSEIVVNEELTRGLDGLEDFSHVIILYWMHRIPLSDTPLKVHPMGRAELPLTGVFATRAPGRPNRIGATTVKLLQRQENILTVQGLDAVDGTPVIDIKPYIPQSDSITDVRIPQWITEH
jgi:tRNA-Thr(GGU) m(6)t(6)A37 methyltransferase TsaA